jgi:hypothetical protein
MIMSDTAMVAPRGAGDSPLARGFADATASDTGVDRYRVWVSDHRITAAILAGLVATHMATIVGYFMPGIGLPQLDWNRINGAIYTPKASSNLQFLSGGVFHYVDGIVFTVLFVVALYPLLRWPSTAVGNTFKGLAFGTLLATVSCAFMIPRVYFPHGHVGFFSYHLGWKLILAVYVWHWVYGLHLGLMYNPLADRSRQRV